MTGMRDLFEAANIAVRTCDNCGAPLDRGSGYYTEEFQTPDASARRDPQRSPIRHRVRLWGVSGR